MYSNKLGFVVGKWPNALKVQYHVAVLLMWQTISAQCLESAWQFICVTTSKVSCFEKLL
jgi:hypothetical protein